MWKWMKGGNMLKEYNQKTKGDVEGNNRKLKGCNFDRKREQIN